MATGSAQIAKVLSQVDISDERALRVAYDIYRASGAQPVDMPLARAPEGSFVYHLRDGAFSRQLGSCALVDGTLAGANGVVMGEGHADLRCSHRSCSFKTCPVALAACFSLYHRLSPEDEVPVLSDIEKRKAARKRRGLQFLEKWLPLTVGSERALRLLVSERENDFAGVVIADDESYRADFVSDVAALLAAMHKIDRHAVRSVRATSLLNRVDPDGLVFRDTGDDNLAPRTLYVIDRLGDFVGLQGPRHLKDFIIERLGRIVDNRYVLLVGTRAEVALFMGLAAAFHFTFEKNQIELGYMAPDQVFQNYLEDLDDDLRIEAQADVGFRERFCSFVAFNADALPFKGRELADYLAKGANAEGRLELPESRYRSGSLDEMLDQIVGLEDVKDTMRRLERFAIFRKTAAGRGAKLPPASFHMLFTGSPGTGKTTVARMVASMLYKIGITRQATCKEVTAKDLIGEYVGSTAPKTAKAVTEALGGVLFIDEAYSLTRSQGLTGGADYGAEAVAELIKIMEDHREDLVVIFAGYEREMSEFVDSNPGISSRIGYRFRFDDYSTDELLEIFRRNVSSAGFSYDSASMDPVLREIFDYHRRFRSFGNGRFVGTLVQKSIVKHANPCTSGEPEGGTELRLTVEDIPTRQELFDIQNWQPRPASELLAPLVGMDELKERICSLEKVASYHERCVRDGLSVPSLNLNMVLTGNPGTGKTTVARIIAQVLYNVGAVPTDHFVEVEAKDLTSSVVGGSSTETERALESAMGGVLFIDEAYSLLESHDGAEVIAQLVKAMEDHQGELSVMFAGYRAEMRRFIDLNPGLASRIGYSFHFDDYDADELEEMFERKMSSYGFEVDADALVATREIFRYFHNVDRFGNGRFVDKVIQEIIARRSASEASPLAAIRGSDVPSIEDLCKVVSMPVLPPNDEFTDDALRRVAVHEMGHAACQLELSGETDIMVVTIEREATGALGYVQHKASASELPTASDLEARIAGLMGGMAAEQLVLGDYSAGNSSDLQQATTLSCDLVARYGMSAAGFVQYVGDESGEETNLAELPPEVRAEINEVMRRCFVKAQEAISAHRAAFDCLVEVLLTERTISGERAVNLWRECRGKGALHE